MKFTAGIVECSSRSGVETVFLGNEQEQLALTITNYPGTKDHYFEWNDQSNSFTNAILFCWLAGSKLEVRLTLDAAKAIGESIFAINLKCSDEELGEVSQGLADILGSKFSVKKSARPAKQVEKPKPDYSQIMFLDLRGKKLKELPRYVAEMTSLRIAQLSGNPQLNLESAFEILGNLPVKDLSITTDFPIPENIGRLSQLENLMIDGLTKPQVIPESFGQLRTLRQLLIMGESDVILPESFAELSELQSLTMRVASWQLPSEFYRLTSLTSLDLSNCRLSEVPEEMAGMSDVLSLMLSGTEPYNYSQLMPIVAHMPNLKIVDLALDPIPKEIGLCQQIEELAIYGGSGEPLALPDELFDLDQLKRLRINYSILGEVPTALRRLKSLEMLGMPECEFETLPEWVGELSNLTILNLSENPILNSLPSSLSKMSSLRVLSIRDCPQLKRLPDGLEALQNLEQVNISNWDAIENVPAGWREKFSH